MKNRWVWGLFCLLGLLLVSCQKENSHAIDKHKDGKHKEEEVYYTCSMHPQIHEKHMGKCPICHMDLTRVEVVKGEDKASTEKVKAAPEAKMKMLYRCRDYPDVTSETVGECPIDGTPMIKVDMKKAMLKKVVAKVRLRKAQLTHFHPDIVPVISKRMSKEVRLLGLVKKVEDKISDIPAQIEGRVEKVYVDSVGREIHKGDPLVDIYSSRLIAAGEEYLLSRKSYEKSKRRDQKRLFIQAQTRLLQWGISQKQIDEWYKRRKIPDRITIYSQISGVVEKMYAAAGKYFKEGQSYFQIADLGSLWVELKVYEQDSARIKLGQQIKLSYNALPEKKDHAVVNFINPFIDEKTRTLSVRVTVDNSKGDLMPGMVADARASLDLGVQEMVIPKSAIIDTGKRKVVWKKVSETKYQAVEIETGVQGDSDVAVISGLDSSDQIVIDGNFLLDAQAQLFGGYE